MSKQRATTVRALAILAGLMIFATGAANADSSSASLQVSVNVQARAILTVEEQPSQVTVTGEDIRRGFVEVASASRINVRSNSPNGYLIGFEVTPGPFRQVEVTGLGNPVEIGVTGGTIAQPYNGSMSDTARLSYRFLLSSDAQPGAYSWPLALSANAR